MESMESDPLLVETPQNQVLWEKIEESESYLVSCMYEEAAASSSSVLEKLCGAIIPTEFDCSRHEPILESGNKEQDNLEVNDMLEAAGMVFIQAYRDMHRTSDIFQDLKAIFGSVALMPYSVLFTGACMQIHEGEYLIARDTLDEFFKGWSFAGGESCYILSGAERQKAPRSRLWTYSHLPRKKYMQIVELYALIVLVKGFKNAELALNWLEKTDILEEERQDIALKIRSAFSPNEPNTDRSFSHPLTTHKQEASKGKEVFLNDVESKRLQVRKAATESTEHSKAMEICRPFKQNQIISRMSGLLQSLSLWFPTFSVKLGNLRIALPESNSIFICAAIMLLIYILKRKSEFVKRNLRERLRSLRRTFVDFWQLAFSVQVNPLAAVQPLPSASSVGR